MSWFHCGLPDWAQLGVTLLERNSRHVRLTDAGQALLREGRKTLTQAQRAIKATRAASAARLTVGFYGSAASALLPDVMRTFNERHPQFAVSVRELLLGSIDDILDGTVHVAFTRLHPGQTELEVEVLTEEPRVVALAVTHPLADRASLRYADLRDEGFIINPVVRDESPLPRWVEEQRRHGLPGRIEAQATSIQEILALVAAGRGVRLVPSTATQHYPRTDIAYVPVTDADPALVSLAWPPGRVCPAVKAFIDTAGEVATSVGRETGTADRTGGIGLSGYRPPLRLPTSRSCGTNRAGHATTRRAAIHRSRREGALR